MLEAGAAGPTGSSYKLFDDRVVGVVCEKGEELLVLVGESGRKMDRGRVGELSEARSYLGELGSQLWTLLV